MKQTFAFSRHYKYTSFCETGGIDYNPSSQDDISEKLDEKCIYMESSGSGALKSERFFWQDEDCAALIDVSGCPEAGRDGKYEKLVDVQLMSFDGKARLPSGLLRLLKQKGFKKEK